MTFPFGQDITVSRSGGTDWNGDPLPAVNHTISGCAIWQNSSVEDMQGRDTTVTTRSMLVPNGADILNTDMVYLPGEDTSKPSRWQVNGDPHPWHDPLSGWSPGTEVQLKIVTG